MGESCGRGNSIWIDCTQALLRDRRLPSGGGLGGGTRGWGACGSVMVLLFWLASRAHPGHRRFALHPRHSPATAYEGETWTQVLGLARGPGHVGVVGQHFGRKLHSTLVWGEAPDGPSSASLAVLSIGVSLDWGDKTPGGPVVTKGPCSRHSIRGARGGCLGNGESVGS